MIFSSFWLILSHQALLASELVTIHWPKDMNQDGKPLEVALSTTKVNTTLPGRMLLLGWGPYALLYLYAAVADVSFISPKLQMVPALIAKTMPTINAINYALRSEMVCRGTWQCRSAQKSKQDRTQ